MRMSLLEMVQDILSAMDSDEVNSISDTVESMQVATLIKNLYYDVAVDLNLPEHQSLVELNASTDADKPVLMHVPNNVLRITDISYDTRGDQDDTVDLPNWKKLCYLPLPKFIEYTQSMRSGENNISSMQVTSGGDTFEFIHRTDCMPTYYTSFDDFQLIFDSFDNSIENTLQKSKTMCYGARYADFEMQDDFIPGLDATQFPYFFNRAKVRAFGEIKQQANQEAASEARRQKIKYQVTKNRTPAQTPFQKRQNYGR